MRCLVTGATGYLGGRLVPRLLADGHEVRCLVRSPEKLRDVPWAADVEIVRGDVLGDLDEAMRDVEVVHYLVHSLLSKDFADADRKAAENVAAAAERADVRRIVYLGGLHPEQGELSPHLASRKEVGEVFLRSAVPAVVLQAAVIIGSGSASFEMLRYLTERLPVMVTPRWVHNRIQPIAVRDVLRYLVEATTLAANRTFDIGGPDVLTYLEMMLRYARVAGLPPAPRAARARSDAGAVLALGQPGHARPGVDRETVDRVAGARGGVPRERHPRAAARRERRLRQGGRARADQDPRRRRGDPLVGSLGAGCTG